MDQISVSLTKFPLNISDAFEYISSPNCGANFIFIGTTRINEHHNDLRYFTKLKLIFSFKHCF